MVKNETYKMRYRAQVEYIFICQQKKMMFKKTF